MVIDSGNINNPGSPTGKTGSSVPSKAGPSSATSNSATPAATPSTEDSVSLSSMGQSIAKIESQLASSSEVNEARVQELKDAIASGTYTIDANAIADKMLSEEASSR